MLEPTELLLLRACEECKTDFTPRKRWQLFCSAECRNRHHNKKRLERVALARKLATEAGKPPEEVEKFASAFGTDFATPPDELETDIEIGERRIRIFTARFSDPTRTIVDEIVDTMSGDFFIPLEAMKDGFNSEDYQARYCLAFLEVRTALVAIGKTDKEADDLITLALHKCAPVTDVIRMGEWDVPRRDNKVHFLLRPARYLTLYLGNWKIHPTPGWYYSGKTVISDAQLREIATATVYPPAGWTVHPQAPDYFYKGQTVLSKQQLYELFAGRFRYSV